MRKIILALLLMFSVFTFANTPPSEVNQKVNVETLEKKAVEIVDSFKIDETKTVQCVIFVDGEPEIYEYSCFFCWGGSMNGCMAEGCKFYLVCFE